MDHICWIDDTTCHDCSVVDVRQAMLNYINTVEKVFGRLDRGVVR